MPDEYEASGAVSAQIPTVTLLCALGLDPNIAENSAISVFDQDYDVKNTR